MSIPDPDLKPSTSALGIRDLIARAKSMSIDDGSDYPPRCSLNKPATDAEVAELANRCNMTLPIALVDLLTATNGGDLFGIHLVGTDEGSADIPDRKWISVQNWGNGDFDWIVADTDPDYDEGNIVFYDHESGNHAKVADTLNQWLSDSLDEIESVGGMLHPYDYLATCNQAFTGVYRPVFEKIKA